MTLEIYIPLEPSHCNSAHLRSIGIGEGVLKRGICTNEHGWVVYPNPSSITRSTWPGSWPWWLRCFTGEKWILHKRVAYEYWLVNRVLVTKEDYLFALLSIGDAK